MLSARYILHGSPFVALNLADAPELVTPGDLGDELASFVRAMRASNVSPNTILAYGGAVRQFAEADAAPDPSPHSCQDWP